MRIHFFKIKNNDNKKWKKIDSWNFLNKWCNVRINWISYSLRICSQIASNVVFSIKIPEKYTENVCEQWDIKETKNWIRLLSFEDNSKFILSQLKFKQLTSFLRRRSSVNFYKPILKFIPQKWTIYEDRLNLRSCWTNIHRKNVSNDSLPNSPQYYVGLTEPAPNLDSIETYFYFQRLRRKRLKTSKVYCSERI